ncbi:unnamed protein product [Clonostachys rosea]|uniref:Uncharacterized protein n=1 Tax=Bionectria ochroleuca TaxID=29856 RepID=A0ABY6UWR7_BIOOC|nr:unnamed protein product [Clonostachys rosea]
MRKEASAVVYGSNIFNLVDTTEKPSHLLHYFFVCIGSLNSGSLTHLCIKSPTWSNRRIVISIAQTLELFLRSQNASGLTNAMDDNPSLAIEALLQIDAQLNAIESLVNIIVRLYDKNLNPSLKKFMQVLGWTVLRGDEMTHG